jgi:carnitine-CoA ligase
MKNVVKDNKVQPSPNDVVMPYLLDKLSNDRPNDNFAEFDSGEEWSYRRTALLASSAALALKRLSVNKGDKVIVWLPNGELSLKAWFSINWIGGVSVAINTAYKGNLLSHVLENSGAKIAFVHPSLLERLLDLKSTHGLKCIITDSEHALRFRDEFAKFDISLVPFDILETDSTYAPPVKGLKPWDEQSICYTSGTTGPSKGVISSYMHLYSMGLNCTIGVDANDRFLINLPLFHVGGI